MINIRKEFSLLLLVLVVMLPIVGYGASQNFNGSITGNAETVTCGVYTDAANSMSLINPLTTIAESWIGPSSTAGIYFKDGNVGIGMITPTSGKLVVAGNIDLPYAGNWRYIKNSSVNGGLRLITGNGAGTEITGFELSSGGNYVKLNHRTSVAGSIKLSSDTTACSATNRGAIRYTAGVGGAADTFDACTKSAADVYAWRAIYTAP